jgi:hypothetical protein
MAKGDHIYINCSAGAVPYQHHGIDMGDGTVIHLAPALGARIALRDSTERFQVRRDTLDAFSDGAEIFVKRHDTCLPADEITRTAEELLGTQGYSLLGGNCEHFAALCATGTAESSQIDAGEATIAAFLSGATKAAWSISARLGSKYAIKGATKLHPMTLLADGVEIAVLAVGCQKKLSPRRSKMLARIGGTLTAAGVGTLLGGPAGAAVCVASHAGSTALAETATRTIRKVIS